MDENTKQTPQGSNNNGNKTRLGWSLFLVSIDFPSYFHHSLIFQPSYSFLGVYQKWVEKRREIDYKNFAAHSFVWRQWPVPKDSLFHFNHSSIAFHREWKKTMKGNVYCKPFLSRYFFEPSKSVQEKAGYVRRPMASEVVGDWECIKRRRRRRIPPKRNRMNNLSLECNRYPKTKMRQKRGGGKRNRANESVQSSFLHFFLSHLNFFPSSFHSHCLILFVNQTSNYFKDHNCGYH